MAQDLHALSPDIISKQATINIGIVGHVAHGKSTVVKAISGIKTVRFKDELKRNITIKIGYANAKIFKCLKCPRPGCYQSLGSGVENATCKMCGELMTLLRHVSFVDCPGHEHLMATMLSGSAVMDSALLLIAGNEICPQPQTMEHLVAIEIMKLNNIIVVQNKIDLVREREAREQYQKIQSFLKDTIAEGAPIIPVSAQLGYNADVLCEYIVKKINIPKRVFTYPPRMIVIRSFDVNKPGSEVRNLKGGVAGGSILQGILRIGQEIEIRPGILTRTTRGLTCKPIFSRVISLFAEENSLELAVPGGLIGVGTQLDPVLCRANRLVGQVLGTPGTLPPIMYSLEVEYTLMSRLIGIKTELGQKQSKVQKMAKGEVLMVNIGSTTTGGRVDNINGKMVKLILTAPVCTEIGEKIAMSRRYANHWRLIGWGIIKN